MNCPKCGEETRPNKNLGLSDTCLSCGFTFRPEEHDDLDKVLEAANNLRSLIVTLSTGQDVTFSFPKDLEPTEEAKRETWRDLLTQHTIVTCTMMFRVGIANTVFDDEIEVKRG